MRIVLPLLLAIVTATVAGAGPYDGRYRPESPEGDDWDCKTIGRDHGAILMTSTVFFALGSRCTLRNPVVVGELDSTLYQAICRSDAKPWHTRIMIMKTNDGIAVIQKGARISKLRKCE
jgi:hypothetical protein